MKRIRSIAHAAYDLSRRTIEEYLDDDAPLIAAGLAFYTILSLAPLLVLIVTLVGPFLGQHGVRVELEEEVRRFAGPAASRTLTRVLDQVTAEHLSSLSAAVGGAVVLFGATNVFVHLQRALNKVWNVRVVTGGKLKRQLWKVTRKRLLSALVLLLVVAVVLASLLAGTALELLLDALPFALPGGSLYRALDFVVTLAMTVLLFSTVFKILPDVRIAYRDVWIGGSATGVLFVVGKFPIALYLGHWSMRSAFGTASSLVLVMLWAYYCWLIFLFGAEFTEVYAKAHGSGIRPEEHAARVRRRLRAPPEQAPEGP